MGSGSNDEEKEVPAPGEEEEQARRNKGHFEQNIEVLGLGKTRQGSGDSTQVKWLWTRKGSTTPNGFSPLGWAQPSKPEKRFF